MVISYFKTKSPFKLVAPQWNIVVFNNVIFHIINRNDVLIYSYGRRQPYLITVLLIFYFLQCGGKN